MRLALATFALISLATASCALTPQVMPELTLTGGQAVAVPEADVTLVVTEVEDQRCPAGVDCVWEGMVRVRLSVTTPASTQTIVLCNRCDDGANLTTAAGWTFRLVGLQPSTEDLARQSRAPVLADYVVTVTYGRAD